MEVASSARSIIRWFLLQTATDRSHSVRPHRVSFWILSRRSAMLTLQVNGPEGAGTLQGSRRPMRGERRLELVGSKRSLVAAQFSWGRYRYLIPSVALGATNRASLVKGAAYCECEAWARVVSTWRMDRQGKTRRSPLSPGAA